MSAEGRHVLVVDDDENIRTVLELSIRGYGSCAVTTAGSGREAIDLVSESEFDLIVLDVMMPGMDGIETLAELRRFDAEFDVPVVFLTAKTQSSNRRQLLDLGAAAVISKPFDPPALVSDLCRIVGHGV